MHEIDAIRARRAALTDAPWTLQGKRSDYATTYVWAAMEDDRGGRQICAITGAGTEADAAFIAAAPADIDTLLARVAALERALLAVGRAWEDMIIYEADDLQPMYAATRHALEVLDRAGWYLLTDDEQP